MNYKILKISKEKRFSFTSKKLLSLKSSDFKYRKSKDTFEQISRHLSFSSSLDMNFSGSTQYIDDDNFDMHLAIRLNGYYIYFNLHFKYFANRILIINDKKKISFEEIKPLYYKWEYEALCYNNRQVISEICSLEDFINNREMYLPIIEMMLQ